MHDQQPQIINRPALGVMLGLSTRTVDRLIKAGKIPKPSVYSHQKHGWSRDVIDRWLTDKHAEANAEVSHD